MSKVSTTKKYEFPVLQFINVIENTFNDSGYVWEKQGNEFYIEGNSGGFYNRLYHSKHCTWAGYDVHHVENYRPGPKGWPTVLCRRLQWCNGAMVHASLAGLGLSAILTTSPAAFSVIKWVGAFYLIYLGYVTIANTLKVREDPSSNSNNVLRLVLITNALIIEIGLVILKVYCLRVPLVLTHFD